MEGIVYRWRLSRRQTYHMTNNHLVLQTDFGLQDGAVSSMRGVAFGVHTGSFEQTYHVGAGPEWAVTLTKVSA